MNIAWSYYSELNAEGITAGRYNGSVFLFITDRRSQKTISKNVSRFAAVFTDSELVSINAAASFVENL